MGETIGKKKLNTEGDKPIVHTSVRELVEFIFREGDIDNRQGKALNPEAMMEGTRIHKKIQNSKDATYMPEVPLKITIENEWYQFVIEGRADGIGVWEEEDICYIDEIKGVYKNLSHLEEPVYVHKAQAMCYAYIYAWQNSLEKIAIQMTYCNLDTEECKYFKETIPFESLSAWFDGLVKEYQKWADFRYHWKKRRQASIKELEFPFPYRNGQKKLVADVYRTIARKKTLFLQAPTGVGKTISTVFPAVKAVGEELGDRIFYLTAKTITGTVAKETFALLKEQGYVAKTIQLTAKEKLCVCEEMECNPMHCPYAKGHYDRVNDAVFQTLTQLDTFTREEIIAQAKKWEVCPFEFSLDISSWVDNIICDYNYVFDPNVHLKRFFQEGIKGDYILLIDEAHNLVDRSREMYSAQIYKEDFLAVKRIIKNRSKKLERALDKCNKILLDYKRECENYVEYENIGNLLFALMRLAAYMDEFLQDNVEFPDRKTVLEFYLNLRNFLAIYELVDEHYVIYSQLEVDGRFLMKLFCVDPSANLQERLDLVQSTILFSATFLPIQYYKSLLSTKEDNYAIYAETTFEQSQRLLLFGRDVSSKYTRRTQSEFIKIASYISKTVACQKGNYMVFFPSYKMMNQVYEVFISQEKGDVTTIVQDTGMTEAEREIFLQNFEETRDNTLVAFCVMGGIFGEGIDLKNEQLIGTIIVGTGIPQISNEREILKNYFDRRTGNGFDYAFRYPGMNKVLQAAGRVIRTTEDRGIILLLDERFLQSDYRGLYPREWADRSICDLSNLQSYLNAFWNIHSTE